MRARKKQSSFEASKMKRTHSHEGLTALPDPLRGNPKILKSKLEGTHRLHVVSVLDISKPAAKPIDEIEEPEEEDKALQNRLNKNNARMLLLNLEDSAKNQIKAVETEVIGKLSSVKKHSMITIQGPVDIRCGNIMLEAKHVSNVQDYSCDDSQIEQVKRQDTQSDSAVLQATPEDIEKIKHIPLVDLDDDFDDDDDCIILE